MVNAPPSDFFVENRKKRNNILLKIGRKETPFYLKSERNETSFKSY